MEKFKQKIEDDRLTIDMERTRSGKTQLFRKDYGDRNFTSEENADVVLTPPSKEMYAELIDGVWYWVKGCNKCKDSMNYGEKHSYQVCYEHDRCVSCGTHREDLTDIPWGHKDGFKCKVCADKEIAIQRSEAFEKVNAKDYDEWDYKYNTSVICPHCGSDMGTDCIDHDEQTQEHECELCGGSFKLELDFEIKYSTKVIGERLTA